jgi:hypothetical protein
MKLTRLSIALLAGALISNAALADEFVTVLPGSSLSLLDLSSTGVTLGTSGQASTSAGVFTISNTGTGVVVGETAPVVLGDNGTWQPADFTSWAPTRELGAYVNGNFNSDNSVLFSLAPGQTTSFVGLNWVTDATSGLTPGNLTFQVLGAQGQTIATYSVAGLPPLATANDINYGNFIGYMTDGADISGFRVLGGYHAYGDITFAAPVPEPQEIMFMIAGLSAIGVAMRRRKANAAAAA